MEPILLLEWLAQPTGEVRQFPHDRGVRFCTITSRDHLIHEITSWLGDNPYAQFLYIGAHGDERGLFPNPERSIADRLDYTELAQLLRDHVSAGPPIWLWLGACSSAAAAGAWNHEGNSVPVQGIVGFSSPVPEVIVETTLKRLVQGTAMDPIVYVDEELERLRKISPAVDYSYKYAGEFVSTDQFDARTRMSFADYLDKRGQLRGTLY